MAIPRTFIVLLVLFWFSKASAQCSDAGVCSLHSNDNGIFRRSGLGVDYLNGYSGMEDSIRYESVKVAAYYWFNRQFNFGVVLPVNRQTSNRSGRIQGIGDLIIVAD